LAWRRVPGFGVAEAVVLALFFAVGAYTLHFHEKWDDEAQAWLIARDNNVWQILRHRLHYEGAPPLWHLLLHVFHGLGGTYVGIGWLGLVCAAGGMYVWLRWSPFPAVLRLVVPFTFFFQYQYAVISRSYVLFPLCLFALCALYRRREKVLLFALFAGLLANISLQGFAAATTLVAVYLFDLYRSGGLRAGSFAARRKQQVGAAVLFAAMACTAVYCAIPAPDLNFGIGQQVSTGLVHRTLMALIGETPRNVAIPPPDPPIFTPAVQEHYPDWRTEPKAWLALQIFPRSAPTDHYALHWFMRTVGPNLLEFACETTWPIANSNLLGCAFMITAVWWLRRRRQLRMLLPWLALMAIGQVLWTAEHHAGMLLAALLAGFWLAFEAAPEADAGPRLEAVFVGLFAVVLVLQVAWSVYCIRADVYGSYDPGPETAAWLKEQAKPRMAVFGFATVSTQPWFARNPYFDEPTAYWQWSSNVLIDANHRAVIATHPDIVVYGLEFPGFDPMRDQWLPLTHISLEEEMTLPRDPVMKDLREHGYRETHRFCGARFARFSSAYRVCDMVFEPAHPAQDADAGK
jgi:hypothetical protein